MAAKKSYAEKLKDPRWQKRRLQILDDSGWMCQDCGKKDRELHVHHCGYASGREPWQYTSNSLMALCKSCHERRQAAEDRVRIVIAGCFKILPVNVIEHLHEVLYALLLKIDGFNVNSNCFDLDEKE